jgi:hypothetical protein
MTLIHPMRAFIAASTSSYFLPCLTAAAKAWAAGQRNFSDFSNRPISPLFQPVSTCPPLPAKTLRFPSCANQLHLPYRPTPIEGRIMIVFYAGWDAVDAGGVGA